ncbi:superfamily I DNA/RNA helicase [Paraburkholderia sp. RAU2J]|uniref:UvrD-helicase domain-containing protein n=1 Tax=Paraburkholderia sp. RAU2J TaxID=1938810 RepID=UPI000F0E27BD|nr:ATP-dependent helicase [Paraburkholderia sp. RAU2J]RKT20433.1 superfamily I DNA/RNA helicase [Paraburkholderia sp. RAU2J]
MEFQPTKEQSDIINADLSPHCVIACPGSGKTATAVRRLLEIRTRLQDNRGHIALFSYSNIAVETFRGRYRDLSAGLPAFANRVLIETADAFVASYILRPHGARVMEASRAPFLVTGNEPFLRGARISDGVYPHDISELRIRFLPSRQFEFAVQPPGRAAILVDSGEAKAAIKKVGKMGAYTYELARYWSLLTLAKEQRILQALAKRFPHLLVDEAQDIGPLHGLLISLLSNAGSILSLVGDPNQGIYDFAGADGSFLRDYAQTAGVACLPLSENRRSVRTIVAASNAFAVTKSTPYRAACERTHGAFYLHYDENNIDALVTAFKAILEANKYTSAEAAVLCRSTSTVDKLKGGGDAVGQGATESFALSALARDRAGDIATSFEHATAGLLKLLATPENTLYRDILDASAAGDVKILRRLLWGFVRSCADGLPDTQLPGRNKWHPQLKKRLASLLEEIEAQTSYKRSPTWTNNLTVAKLGDEPLWKTDLAQVDEAVIRVDTVHQAKGEGIAAVLFVARTVELNKLLAGMHTEEGRIGYVAVTRAEDLLIIGVPNTASKKTVKELEGRGVRLWPA